MGTAGPGRYATWTDSAKTVSVGARKFDRSRALYLPRRGCGRPAAAWPAERVGLAQPTSRRELTRAPPGPAAPSRAKLVDLLRHILGASASQITSEIPIEPAPHRRPACPG